VSACFDANDLKTVVDLTGRLLESEDRFVCGCVERNPVYKRTNQIRGIWLMENERYFQWLTFRPLLPSFPLRVELEHCQFDIALFRERQKEPVALGEMKVWRSAKGEEEIPDIQADIQKLAREQCAQFLLIFTLSPRGETDKNVG